jgi:hypothetical protein
VIGEKKKGVIEMKKKWVALMLFPLFLAGCLAMEPLQVREATYGKNLPAITNSFAAKEIYPGETWKVYINAQDPDGDMKNIVCVIEQPGVGVYPVSITRIREGDRKELSGYVTLFTAFTQGLNLVNLTLTLQIQDEAGHYSAPVSFPLSFNNRYHQEPPPPGVFQDKDLGPIMLHLRTIGDGQNMYDDD